MVHAPDVLVIVMDCVRESDFRPSTDGTYLPFAAALAKESVRYDQALAPASWTVPSHASLFSGLYPWEHGITTFSGLTPNPGFHTIASHLRPRGYGSVSVSANFLIGTELGIADDFDQAFWGGWWEPYFRYPIPYAPTIQMLRKVPFDSLVSRGEKHAPSGIPGLLRTHSSQVLKHVYLLDVVNRFTRFLNEKQDLPMVSPWVEPTLRWWVNAQPKEKPLFAFVNLLDAHEPYFAVESLHGWRAWLDYARLPQERWGWIDGETRVPADRLAPLHRIYRHMIGILDERIRRICEIFRAAGRWNDTLVVVTSDHGQSFGEHGRLFHAQGVEREVVHVPLWVRFPGGENGGKIVTHWASLVDVVPTIDAVTRCPDPMKTSGYPLGDLISRPRPGPAFSMSDGYGHRMVTGLASKHQPTLAPCSMTACRGRWKVIVDDLQGESKTRAFDVWNDPDERRDVWDPTNAELSELASQSRQMGARILGGKHAPPKPEVVERLASWGYT